MKCNNTKNARSVAALRSLQISIIIAMIALIGGCLPQRYISKHRAEICRTYCQVSDSTASTISISERDTNFAPFEAAFLALMECDSANNVILQDLSEVSATNGKLIAKINGNELQIRFLTDSLRGKVFTRYEKIYVKDQIENPVNIELSDRVKKLEFDNAKLSAKANKQDAKIKAKNKHIVQLISIASVLLILIIFAVINRFKKLL